MSKVKAEIEETAKQEIISQWGVTAEEGSLYRVERGFHLNTKLGPPIPVKKGDIVRLSEKLAMEVFYGGKVTPVNLGETFQAIRPLRTVDGNGEWLDVERGDVLKLDRNEAIKLLRQGTVRELKKGVTV